MLEMIMWAYKIATQNEAAAFRVHNVPHLKRIPVTMHLTQIQAQGLGVICIVWGSNV